MGYRRQINDENGSLAELAVEHLLQQHGTVEHRSDNHGSPDLILTTPTIKYGIEVKSISVYRHSKREKHQLGSVRIDKSSLQNLFSFCYEHSLKPLFIIELRFIPPIGDHYFIITMDILRKYKILDTNHKTINLSFLFIYNHGIYFNYWEP